MLKETRGIWSEEIVYHKGDMMREKGETEETCEMVETRDAGEMRETGIQCMGSWETRDTGETGEITETWETRETRI